MRVRAEIDLKALGLTTSQWREFIKDQPWEEIKVQPKWSQHMRDHIQGWQLVGNVQEISGENWLYERGYTKPGVYALVWDPKNTIKNPITYNQTIVFGETIQSFHKRIYSHVGGLKGRHTNTKAKWEGHHLKQINEYFECDIKQDLASIKIWFKPHDLLDPAFAENKLHSQLMETQCQALYWVIWGCLPPANRRDAPNTHQTDEARKLLAKLGYLDCERKTI
jgi:hypothetical protein